MKMTALILAVAGLIGSASGTAHAGDWTFLAGNKSGYTAKPTVSLMLGRMSPGDDFRSATIFGAELSLDCPLLQPPTNRIRQQISVTSSSSSGVDINNYEINPHYVVVISPGFEIGGGPGLGLVTVDTPTGDGNVLGLQFGASAHYHSNNPLFFGAEMRYQITSEDNFEGAGSSSTNVNNFRFAVKVGYSF